MKYIKDLKNYGKKTISKTELEKLFAVSSEKELFEIISTLSEQKILTPIKNAKTNGNRVYPIYLKYKVLVPLDTYDAELEEIKVLHPMLLNNGYLQAKPEEYKKYRNLIQRLDRYLFSCRVDDVSISRKERSFEIFDEEKVLDDKTFCCLLERIGITSSILGFYDTPEYCFNDFIPKKTDHMTLLICENKDIWFNIRRMMFENHCRFIFDTRIDGVIYGCGNKISSIGALSSYTEFVGAQIKYLYWGDIDREGLNIYLRTVRNNPQIDIGLFIPAYEEMLQLAQSRCIPNSRDMRERMDDYGEIFNYVKQSLRSAFEQSIQSNKRIPQEIISYAFLKVNMR